MKQTNHKNVFYSNMRGPGNTDSLQLDQLEEYEENTIKTYTSSRGEVKEICKMEDWYLVNALEIGRAHV